MHLTDLKSGRSLPVRSEAQARRLALTMGWTDYIIDAGDENRIELRQPRGMRAGMADELMAVGPWVIFETQDHDDDARKLSFFAVHQDTGATHALDVSPNRRPDLETVRMLIDLGFPGRVSGSPLTPREIRAMWAGDAA